MGCRRPRAALLARVRERGLGERGEQRVWAVRTRLELGVVLRAEIEGMAGKLRAIDKAAIGREPGEPDPVALEEIPVGVVAVEPIPVALAHDRSSVAACGWRAGLEGAGMSTPVRRR